MLPERVVDEAPAPGAEDRARKPTKVVLVGAGMLGSQFAEELSKRFFAFDEPLELVIVDDDTIDERNPANHLYNPQEEGEHKCDALAVRVARYAHLSEGVCRRIGEGDAEFEALLESADLLIDAVDNLPTRHYLWAKGLIGTPCLHLGVSQDGTGAVEWTVGDFDTFSLSPIQLAGLSPEVRENLGKVAKLPPCELVGFRGVGFLTSLAAAKSACIVFGIDPENHAQGKKQFVSWMTTQLSHTIRETHDVG